MNEIWKFLQSLFASEQAPAVNSWVMESDLEKLVEHVKRHFPEAYATSCTTPYGMVWGVRQSPKHHTFGLQETELEAWQHAAEWIPQTK